MIDSWMVSNMCLYLLKLKYLIVLAELSRSPSFYRMIANPHVDTRLTKINPMKRIMTTISISSRKVSATNTATDKPNTIAMTWM